MCPFAFVGDEIEKPGVGRPNGGNVQLVRTDASFIAFRAESFRAAHGLDFIIRAQADGADRGTVHEEIGMGEGISFGVDDEVDVALPVEQHVLAAMPAGDGKTEFGQKLAEDGLRIGIGRELDEGCAAEQRRCRRVEELHMHSAGLAARWSAGLRICGNVEPCVVELRARPLLDEEQGAHAVGRRLPGRSCAKIIVEDFERDRPGIAGFEDGCEEAWNVEISLTREAAKMPAQGESVHRDIRCIGKLHEEDAVTLQLGNGARIVLDREGMKAVEDQAEMRMGGLLDEPPRMAEFIDASAPGESLVADAQPAFRCALGGLAKLRRHAFVVIDRALSDIGADEQERRTEFLHQVEFALDAIEVAQEKIVGDALEIAEGLEKANLQPAVGREQPHLLRRAVEEQKIVFENFDGIEARRRRRLELFRQRSAQGDRGDRSAHGKLGKDS